MASLDAALEAVASSTTEGRWEEIARTLDACELESPNPRVLDEWPHSLHLLGHIYNRTLSDARMLWKRIPAGVKQNNPELEAVWKLLQFSWNRHYQGMWSALQGFQWGVQLKPLVDALVVKTRGELMDLISTAYATVSAAKVATFCGMTEADALAACQGQGWTYDAAVGMLSVVPKPAPKEQMDGYANLQQLSEYMVHVEAAT
ncbi:hypothetical protein FOA52_008020 [Chlamydomonas sp. UWO 241]|nr:hypothetical protein FOA52_008020 [Chlamydomonas sp. UWO 241]